MIWLALYFDLPAKSGKIEDPSLGIMRNDTQIMTDEEFENMMKTQPGLLKVWRLEEIK